MQDLVVEGDVENTQEDDDNLGEKSALKILVALAFTRLVVVGGIQFVFVSFLTSSWLQSMNPLSKLILFIECSSPSANMNIVCCQQAGNKKDAEDLSLGYLIQYVMFIFTALPIISLSIYYLEND